MEILAPESKKIKTKHKFGSKVWTFIQFVFLVCPCWRLVNYIKTCSLLALPHLNLFQKTKTSLGLVSCFIFSRLLEKNISHGIFYWQTKFHRQIAFTYIYGNICNEIICFQFYNVLNLNFETNLSLLIKSYFYMTKKVRQSFK